ncbi:MAG: hypothetical protein KDK66_01555 [Deltaproteobacteria bacterium]|nr:hypothetical protein [Deltaproteobacteria bacterium]
MRVQASFLSLFSLIVCSVLVFSHCALVPVPEENHEGGESNEGATATTYTVGGSLTGLSGTIVLQNNNGDDLTLEDNGSFAFTSELVDGASYEVTIVTQPSAQLCSVANGSGIIDADSVSDVGVTCVTIETPTLSVSEQNDLVVTVLVSDINFDIVSYYNFFGGTSEDALALINGSPLEETTYSFTLPTNTETETVGFYENYYAQVVLYNEEDEVLASSIVTSLAVLDRFVPIAPIIDSLFNEPSSIRITLDVSALPTDVDTTDAANYEIQRSVGASNTDYATITPGLSQDLNTDNPWFRWVPPGDGTYNFRVRVVDTNGNESDWSEVDTIVFNSI